MTKEKIKAALESILFIWGDPLEAKLAAELFDMPLNDMVHILRELSKEYEDRGSGLRIREMDKSFQFCTAAENDDYIKLLLNPAKEKRLSQPALETLAIIAYKQPVTKAQIDSIRGIKSERVIDGLIARDLVKELGRSNAIGRPYQYGTTKTFLKLFGFESLKDLPEIDNIDDIVLEEDLDDVQNGQIEMTFDEN